MTEEELLAIERRAAEADPEGSTPGTVRAVLKEDVPALVAEVRHWHKYLVTVRGADDGGEAQRLRELNAALMKDRGSSALRTEWIFGPRLSHLIVTDPRGDQKREAAVALKVMAAHSRLVSLISAQFEAWDMAIAAVRMLAQAGDATPARIVEALEELKSGGKEKRKA